MLDRGFDDGAELPVLLLLEPDIAGIDAILVERLGAGRMIGQQLVADVMKVADDGDAYPLCEQPVLDMRNRSGRGVSVDCDAHDLRAGARELRYLPCGPRYVGSVGIGHGLHDHRRATAYCHAADVDRDR